MVKQQIITIAETPALSNRVKNALYRYGLAPDDSIELLSRLTAEQLQQIPRLGPVAVEEIKQCLLEYHMGGLQKSKTKQQYNE